MEKNNKIILAAKGSPESIINLCDVNEKEIENNLLKLQEKGLRVIAVAFREYQKERRYRR